MPEFMVGHENEMQRTRISFIEEGVLVLLPQQLQHQLPVTPQLLPLLTVLGVLLNLQSALLRLPLVFPVFIGGGLFEVV